VGVVFTMAEPYSARRFGILLMFAFGAFSSCTLLDEQAVFAACGGETISYTSRQMSVGGNADVAVKMKAMRLQSPTLTIPSRRLYKISSNERFHSYALSHEEQA